MITSAIVLAAGRGSRMGELSEHTPKPLLKVKGKPIMEYVIDLLTAYGITDIGVNLHHHADSIVDYFGDGAKFGANISYVKEQFLSGTAGGVLQVANSMQIKESFLVVSADMLVNFNLQELATTHSSKGGVATLSCYFRPKDQLKKSGVILFDSESKRINKFIERPQNDSQIISQWVNSSVYAFSPKILDFIKDEFDGTNSLDLPKDIFPKILGANQPMYAQPFPANQYYQLGIDSPDRIIRAEKDLESGLFKPPKPN